MNILGATIRNDEIIGISAIQGMYNGDRFYYTFSVLCKGCSVPFNSASIEDVKLATKQEQQELAVFKQQYQGIHNKISILCGDAVAILQEEMRTQKIEADFKTLCDYTDMMNVMLKQSKIKTKYELIDKLGYVWATAKEIKEMAL